MDFEFDDDQEALRASVRRFLAERVPTTWVRSMLDDPLGTTPEVWRGLADLGALGLLVPEAHGGTGRCMIDAGVVLEELGRAVHPGPFLSSAVAATSALVAVSPDGADGAADLLAGLADGSVIATLALHDDGQRSAWRRPTTVADRGGRLTGTKAFVPDAVGADLLLVTAGNDDGVGLYVVERDAAGVEVRPTPTPDGTRKVAAVTLDGAIGRRFGAGDATAALEAVVDRITVAMVVDGVGAASAALDMAVAYAKERVQFDRPIGSFQAVQHLCTDMLVALELGRAGAYYALWACDHADDATRHHAATMAKAWAGDAFAQIGADAIQVHGGIGFTWEHDAHLFTKRLLSLQHLGGSSTDHLAELASLIL